MANEQKLYVVMSNDGEYWMGRSKWDKRLRMALIYSDLNIARDVCRTHAERRCTIYQVSLSVVKEVR